MKLDNLQDDYIEFPFLQENYNTRLKKFAYSAQWSEYKQDILIALGEKGSLWNRIIKKLLTHTHTSQDQIRELFEDIKITRNKMIEKKYTNQLDNTMWEETISFEKDKFNSEELFNLFTQFDNLQSSIPWKDNLSYKEYSDFIERLTTLYYKASIAKAKMNNTLKAFPMKKSDLIKIINTITVNEDLSNSEKENIVENIRKNGPLHLLYTAMLQYPSYYTDLVDFVVNYYEQTIDYSPVQFAQALQSYTHSLEEKNSIEK